MLMPAVRKRAAASAQAVVDAHRDHDTDELFGIAELCREFGITLRSIRFYEDKGLLAPRRVGGTRVYTRRDRARRAHMCRVKGDSDLGERAGGGPFSSWVAVTVSRCRFKVQAHSHAGIMGRPGH